MAEKKAQAVDIPDFGVPLSSEEAISVAADRFQALLEDMVSSWESITINATFNPIEKPKTLHISGRVVIKSVEVVDD